MNATTDFPSSEASELSEPPVATAQGTRLWVLAALTGALAFIIYAIGLGGGATAPLDGLPLWAFAVIALAGAQIGLVLQRRGGLAVSPGAVALALGLLYVQPGLVVLTIAASTALTRIARTPARAAMATSITLLHVTLAGVVYAGLRFEDPFAWGSIMALVLALSAAHAARVAMGAVVVRAVGGRPEDHGGTDTAVPAALGSLGWGGVALVIAFVAGISTRITVIVGVLVSLAALLTWAYVVERHRRRGLELAQGMTRAVLGAAQTEAALVTLLERACSTFHCPIAEVILLPTGDGEHPLRTTLRVEGQREVMVPLDDRQLDGAVLEASRVERGVLLDGAAAREVIKADVGDAPCDVALIAPLRGESRILGTIAVAGSNATDAALEAADVELFGALATNVVAALEYGQVERSLAQLGELERKLAHQAYHDSLTGLANRALFLDLMEQALLRNHEREGGVVVLFVDLDDFKAINDSFGHQAGDAVLVEAAERIRRSLRGADTPARLGGDEFAVLIDGAPGLRGVISVAERILRSLTPPIVFEGGELLIHGSIGIAFSTSSSSAEGLLRDADIAMYRAKGAGKGCFEIFEDSMHADIRHQMDLRTDLARAIQQDELVLHYQPIVELEDARMVGVEALVRWRHPERGMVSPGEFIPLAEETGLIAPLGSWVIAHACRQAGEWHARFPFEPPLSMNINVSASQFREHELARELRLALSANGVPPSSVTLEITESVFKEGWSMILGVLEELRELGVRLAIDDFGTGYSSLTRLQEMPVEVLKIPKPFVDALAGVSGKATLARTVVRIGDTIGMKTVAEGIETVEKWQQLRHLGCDYGQGFFFGRPVESSVLEQHFERSRTMHPKASTSGPKELPPGIGREEQSRRVA